MNQRARWSLEDIDPAAREAASEAARRAGMPVSDWLSDVIARSAAAPDPAPARRETVYHAPPAGTPVGDAIDAIAARLESLAIARRTAPQPNLDALAAATAASERRLRDSSIKTAAALESVARWMEGADSRFSTLAGHVVRESEERQEETTSLVGQAMSAVTERLDTIESRLANGGVASLDPLKEALERVEIHLKRAHGGRAEVERLEETLSSFEERLGTIAERLTARRPSPREGMRESMREGLRRESLGLAMDDIRARRNELDRMPAGSRSGVADEILRGLKADMAKLTGQLDTLQDGVTNGPMWLANEINALSDSLKAIAPTEALVALEAAVKDLGARLDRGPQDTADLAAPLRDLHEEMRALTGLLAGGQSNLVLDLKGAASRLAARDPGAESTETARLAGEVAQLRTLLDEAKADERIPALIEEVARLGRQIAQGPAIEAGEFFALKGMVEDIRDALSGAAGADLSARVGGPMDFAGEFRAHISALGQKIDAVAARFDEPQAALDPRLAQSLERLNTKIDGIEARMSAVPAGADFTRLMENLAGRLDSASAGSQDETALADLSRQVGLIAERLDAPDRATLSAIEQAIAGLTERIDVLNPAGAANGASEDERIERVIGSIGSTLDGVVARIQELERQSQGEGAAIRGAPPPSARSREEIADLLLLEDDAPLEPGSGRPLARPAAPRNDRRTTPELDTPPLAVTRHDAGRAAPPPVRGRADDMGAQEDNRANVKASFIAAARRAAQAAQQEATQRSAKPSLTERLRLGTAGISKPARAAPDIADRQASPATETAETGSAKAAGGLKAMLRRRRPLLLAVAALVLALGTAKLVFDGMAEPGSAPGIAAAPSGNPASAPAPATPPRDVDVTNAIPRQPAVGEAAETSRAAALPTAPSLEPPAAGSAATPAPVMKITGLQQADLPNALGAGLRKAALSGDAAAVYEAAARLAEGREVAKDQAAAARLFGRAAEQGYAPAQFRLGSMLEKGSGLPRDVAAAKSWYRKAADAGHARAMHNLAVAYAEGGDGAPDYSKAAEWFEKAAAHDIRDSQYNVAILHARGLGTPRDLKASYKWFAIAAARGDTDAAKKRDEVGSRLQPAELAEAKAQAESFRPLPLDRAVNEVILPDGGFADAAADKKARQRVSSGQGPRI